MARKPLLRIILVLGIAMPSMLVFPQEASISKAEFQLANLADSIPPRIRINSPQLHDGILHQVREDMVTLTGSVKDESPVKWVAINAAIIIPGDSGSFSCTIELYPGKNQLRIVASDIYYNLAEEFVTIEYMPDSMASGEKTPSP